MKPFRTCRPPAILILSLLLGHQWLPAADPFAENIRPTEPLPPEQQQKTFHLPPGFEIQLVAAETDLRKPMNMAFDALGRLWITESREYPMPAKDPTQARDTVRIYSDFDANGRARKVQIFADGLNIPIGIYPFNSPASNGEKKSTWKVVYLKRIIASAKFEDIAAKLGRPKPFVPEAEIKITSKPNPLAENNAKSELAVRIATAPGGAVLEAADGLPLIHLSDTPGLKWAVMAREGDAITVLQGDGALVEEFKISKQSNVMSFDAGEYELKAK